MTVTGSPLPAPADGAPLRIVGVRMVTVTLLLLAIELGLKHLGGFGWWAVSERSERYGWRMLPDQDARSRDLVVHERINGLGFRDREWDPPVADGQGGWLKDESLFRVAVVGNSMTYGTSVPVEQVYTRVLEDRLAELLAARGSTRRALVMNFAVQGYNFEQMARVYEDVVRPYRPDLLVVPLHPHDIMPMAPAIDDPEYGFRRLVMRTATYDLLVRHVIDRWIPPVPADAQARAKAREFAKLDLDLGESPFATRNRPVFEDAARRMQQVLELVESDGGRLLLLYMPRYRQHFAPKTLNSDTWWKGWVHERRGRVLAVQPWPEFERRMQPLVDEIRAKGLPAETTHDLSTLTWTDAQGRQRRGDELETVGQSLLLPTDMGHFSALGHAVIADHLSATIEASGLLD